MRVGAEDCSVLRLFYPESLVEVVSLSTEPVLVYVLQVKESAPVQQDIVTHITEKTNDYLQLLLEEDFDGLLYIEQQTMYLGRQVDLDEPDAQQQFSLRILCNVSADYGTVCSLWSLYFCNFNN